MPASEQVVYELLSHLKDSVYLQQHPLAMRLEADPAERGEALRQLLLQLIERLKPAEGTPETDPSWRPYRAVRLRYVDSFSPVRVQQALALGDRQVRREQSRAVAALADMLEASLGEADTDGDASPAVASQEAALQRAARALKVSPEALDIAAELRAIRQVLEPRLTESGVRLDVRCPAGLTVFADRVTFRQVMLRVLGSFMAVKQASSVVVTVEEQRDEVCLRSELEGNAGARLLPEEVRRECNYLAILSLGSVRLRSDEGRAAVECRFPRERPFVLLVVDDEEAAVRLMRRYVQGLGILVVGTEEASQAVDMAASLQPDAVALDVLLPDQDGWEVLQQLRATPDTADIPVIVCSVWNEPELALALGASAFIRKPVTRSQLLESLQQILQRGSGEASPLSLP